MQNKMKGTISSNIKVYIIYDDEIHQIFLRRLGYVPREDCYYLGIEGVARRINRFFWRWQDAEKALEERRQDRIILEIMDKKVEEKLDAK